MLDKHEKREKGEGRREEGWGERKRDHDLGDQNGRREVRIQVKQVRYQQELREEKERERGGGGVVFV
jgi:hypothetical protein